MIDLITAEGDSFVGTLFPGFDLGSSFKALYLQIHY